MELLRASVDFLVELCETGSLVSLPILFRKTERLLFMDSVAVVFMYVSIFHFYSGLLEFQVEEASFSNWSHQAVDFILGSKMFVSLLVQMTS